MASYVMTGGASVIRRPWSIQAAFPPTRVPVRVSVYGLLLTRRKSFTSTHGAPTDIRQRPSLKHREL